MTDVEAAVARAFREERAAVLATLIRHVGDFQLAEDALQDAFADAVVAWPRDGVPARPGAWLTVAARRRAIDRVRSERARTAREMITFEEDEESAVVDDRLRLIFTCCHPALAPSARVALTLRALGGLTTGEIARAFLVAEPTMGKRIVRAKRKIAEAHIPYRVPADEDLPDRVRGVLRVLYLIFNEGYAASEGDALVRGELCAEAIRLGRLLVALMPDEAEAWGLLALMLLHDARRAARVDADGHYVALDDQDRTLWDAARIEDGLVALNRALRLRRPGEYQLQAAISAAHLEDPVDWDQVAALYAALPSSPVVEVNRAVAVAFAHGPRRAWTCSHRCSASRRWSADQPLHAAHAELLRQAGELDAAARAYDRAIELSTNAVERAELERRLRGTQSGPSPMAMNLRLSDEQAEALRARADKEGRSMQQIALAAVDEYLLRAEDDELTDRLAARGADRFADLLRRLGE